MEEGVGPRRLRRGSGGKRPQGAFIAKLTSLMYPDRFHELLSRRLRTWFPNLDPLPEDEIKARWLCLRQVLARSQPSKVWSHLKTCLLYTSDAADDTPC
eukprot:5827809-Pyramimonas_sp.AAC.1